MYVTKDQMFNSLLIACYLMVTVLSAITTVLFVIPNISVVIVVCIICIAIFKNANITFIRNIILILIIFIFFIYAFIFNNNRHTYDYFTYFIIFGMASAYLSSLKYDIRILFKYLIRICILYMILYFIFLRKEFLEEINNVSINYWSQQMGVAYSFVQVFITSVLMFELADNKKKAAYMLFISSGALFVILFDCGTRGAIFSLTVFIALFLFYKMNTLKRLLFVVVLVIILIIIINIDVNKALMIVHAKLQEAGIYIMALDKMRVLLNVSTDAGNGRSELYMGAISLIKLRPITGFGIGYFEGLYDGYVHEFLLELLLEFGIIGLIFILIPILKNMKFLMNPHIKNKEKPLYFLFLFSITVPMMLFSTSFWRVPNFWFYFFTVFTARGSYRNKKIFASTIFQKRGRMEND